MASEAEAAPPPAAPISRLIIANVSDIADAEFAATVAAVGRQITEDFQPIWGVGATLTPTRIALGADGHADVDDAADAVVYVGSDTADPTSGAPGAFGYHERTFKGLPYAFIYLNACQLKNEPWSCTLSHEVMELLVDPTTILTATGPAPSGAAGQLVRYDLEVCDPTQGDAYEIDGVTVSNFVTKAYFGMAASGSTNFMDLELAPFGVRPGGYIQYEEAGSTQQVNGPAVTPQAMEARAVLDGYRRNARRAEARKNLA